MLYSNKIIVNLIGFCWLVFLFYWIYKEASGVKKDTLKRQNQGIRILIGVLAVAAVWVISGHLLNLTIIPYAKVSQTGGVILCAFGIGWAIWARKVLDVNWSSHPNIKQNHELVQNGPYAIARHPIYTGMTIAFVGTFIAAIPTWAGLGLLLLGVTRFVYRIPKEERFMTQTFPTDYPIYKSRVRWALFPFIF